ncbi:hypothetical protein BDE36_1351 [Arcticibacter tournemirensis]|uniref:hypothetical protein n=1 Tax=Arcticibacter tournemirensis TaxID=699437 RepID=UPI001171F3C0|nr:hypothetical protein [Arcticibacter tournemirensis]TQM49629.1 hypothetical protein BDE36_1351 [Arcticibacter tournemirensis]
MQKNSFKSPDELILGIKLILSKNRCSFSVDEHNLLKDCIKALEQSKSEMDEVIRFHKIVRVLNLILRVFTIFDHFNDVF